MSLDSMEPLEAWFAALGERRTKLSPRFYERLFTTAPELRSMFPKDMAHQAMKLADTLEVVVSHIHKLDSVAPALMEMGQRHDEYGATPEHYTIVGDTLLATLAEIAGDTWDQRIEDAWRQAIDLISETMLSGVRQR
jgi:hemoglobin-like flavoprotein